MAPITAKQLPPELWLTIFGYLDARDTVNACLGINLPLPYCKNKCFTFNPPQEPALYNRFSHGEFNNCKICKLKLQNRTLLQRDISNLMTFSHLKELRLSSVTFTSIRKFELLATSPLQLNKLDLAYCRFCDVGHTFHGPIIFEYLKILRITRCVDDTPKKQLLSSISANLDLITIHESMRDKFFSKPLLLTAKRFTFDKYVEFPNGFVSNAAEVTPLYNSDLNWGLFPHVNTIHLAFFQFNSTLAARANKICIQPIRSLDDINMEQLSSLDKFRGDFVFGGFEYPMLGDSLEISVSLIHRLEYFLLYTRKMKSKNQTVTINFGGNRQHELNNATPAKVLYGIDTLILNGVHPLKLLEATSRIGFKEELELYKVFKRFPAIRRLIIIARCDDTNLNDWYIDELMHSKFIRGLFPKIRFVCVKRKNKQDRSHTYEDNQLAFLDNKIFMI